MAQELLATARIVFPIETSSNIHKIVAYVRGLTPVGGSWNVNTRTLDENDLPWDDAAQGFWDAYSYLLATAVVAPTAQLEEIDNGVWIPLANAALTGGNDSGDIVQASQLTATFRDTAFKKMKVVFLEGSFVPPFASSIVTAFGGGVTNGLKQWTSSHTVTNPPYTWQVSRGNRYLATSPFVRGVATYNRRLRRDRGLA